MISLLHVLSRVSQFGLLVSRMYIGKPEQILKGRWSRKADWFSLSGLFSNLLTPTGNRASIKEALHCVCLTSCRFSDQTRSRVSSSLSVTSSLVVIFSDIFINQARTLHIRTTTQRIFTSQLYSRRSIFWYSSAEHNECLRCPQRLDLAEQHVWKDYSWVVCYSVQRVCDEKRGNCFVHGEQSAEKCLNQTAEWTERKKDTWPLSTSPLKREQVSVSVSSGLELKGFLL